MVDGTGLENQQINVSQVRILSLPPNKIIATKGEAFRSRLKEIKILELALVFLFLEGCERSETSLLLSNLEALRA